MSAVYLDVYRLQQLCDPFETSPWLCLGDITRAQVAACLERGDLHDQPFATDMQTQVELTPTDHARRIAWLVQHGWTDPISVDVGVPGFTDPTQWPIDDGNHRFAAAIYRNDPAIAAEVSGSLKRLRHLQHRSRRAARGKATVNATPVALALI